jgi:hypothetical protein
MARWPRKMVIEELFINDNSLRNHVHVAARNRRKLKRLARIAKRHYGGTDPAPVREFPPFDPVECVHTPTSWHYRSSRNPDTPRTCANRGNGLAFDLRSVRREEFAREVKRRYQVKRCDF